jgi:mRNA-degrading endonuclease RelE of RelBE toxin-antitoxin system
MKYLIEWRPRARKDLGRLDPEVRRRVIDAVIG